MSFFWMHVVSAFIEQGIGKTGFANFGVGMVPWMRTLAALSQGTFSEA